MNEFFSSLLAQSTDAFQTGFLVFLRVGAAMAVLPVVGERSIPERVRLAIALAFTLIVAPAVYDDFPSKEPLGVMLIVPALSEVVAGLIVGISLRFFVHALQMAGSIIAQSTSLSQLFGGAGVDPQPAIGHLLLVGGFALAVTYGFHVKIAALFIFSYEVISPGSFIAASDFTTWGVQQISRAFSLAFSLAAPFLVASLIYNIALGAINRAMPQLMVSFVGAPAITAGGLFLLLAAAPIMLATWLAALDAFFGNPFGTVH